MSLTDEELTSNVTIKVEDEAVPEVKSCYIWFSENTPPYLLEETTEEEKKGAKVKRRSCVIPGCNNFFFSKKGFPDGSALLSFHKFPKDENLKRIWKSICQKPDKFSANSSYVCSDHFNSEDFCRNTMADCCKTPRRVNRLKPGTIPTRNLPRLEGQPSCSYWLPKIENLAEQDDEIVLEEVEGQAEEQDTNSSVKVFKILNVENQRIENILENSKNQRNIPGREGSWVQLANGQWRHLRQYSRKKPSQIIKEKPVQSSSKEIKVESSASFVVNSSNENKNISIQERGDTTNHQGGSRDSVKQRYIQQNISTAVKSLTPVKRVTLLKEKNRLPNINISIQEREETTSHQGGSRGSVKESAVQQNRLSPAVKSHTPVKRLCLLNEKNGLPNTNFSIQERVATSHQDGSRDSEEQRSIQLNRSPQAVNSRTPVKRLCSRKQKNGVPNTNISIQERGDTTSQQGGPRGSVVQRDIQQNISPPAAKSHTPVKRLCLLKEENGLPNTDAVKIDDDRLGARIVPVSELKAFVPNILKLTEVNGKQLRQYSRKSPLLMNKKAEIKQENLNNSSKMIYLVSSDEEEVDEVRLRKKVSNDHQTEFIISKEKYHDLEKCFKSAEIKQEHLNNSSKMIDLVSSDEEEVDEIRLRKKVSNDHPTVKEKEFIILEERYHALEECFEELKANTSKELNRLNDILTGKEEQYTKELREALSVFLKPEKVEAIVEQTKWY